MEIVLINPAMQNGNCHNHVERFCSLRRMIERLRDKLELGSQKSRPVTFLERAM